MIRENLSKLVVIGAAVSALAFGTGCTTGDVHVRTVPPYHGSRTYIGPRPGVYIAPVVPYHRPGIVIVPAPRHHR